MSGSLSPDVIAAINQVAATPLGRKYDRMARAKYGKSGVALAAKEVIGESGGNENATSSAGAHGLTQFMPATRAEYIKKYGVDAWKNAPSAIKAMMLYQVAGKGVESYNPGMPTYAKYILSQRIDPATNKALIRRGSKGGGSTAGTGSVTVQAPDKTTATIGKTVVPGVSYAAERSQARAGLLTSPGGLTLSKLLNYKREVNQLQDIPEHTVSGDLKVKTTPGKTIKIPGSTGSTSGTVPLGGGKPSGKGVFKIDGPDPKRLKPELVSYATKVARIYGGPLTGKDGSSHSKMTVNGNVSEHYTGNATDIFISSTKELVRAGRAALIAAGMPRAKALKQNGGLYNVGNHQVIFNVNGIQYGGNHLDHLHISAHGK